MSECKDCLHYDICDIMYEHYGIRKVPPSDCGHYKAKADVVEAVRCKDCEFYRKQYHKCELHSVLPDQFFTGFIFEMAEDNFCSYGERREE